MESKHDINHVELPHEDAPDGYYPRSAEERALSRALNRKLDLCVLPFLSLLYLFNGLDRGNVGNAQTQGPSDQILSRLQYMMLTRTATRLCSGYWSLTK
jgi:hypothetical protein